MGAVAWGLWPTPGFPSPLIKPGVPISGTRLSDWLHRKAHDDRPLYGDTPGYKCKSPITLSQQDAPPCGVAPWSLWFRLTLLLASLIGMATTIVAEEGARCGVVLLPHPAPSSIIPTTYCRISVVCPKDRSRTASRLQAHSACRCQRASIRDIPVRVFRLKSTRAVAGPTRQLRARRGYRGHRH
jgi:hypothetical protein